MIISMAISINTFIFGEIINSKILVILFISLYSI